MGTTNKQVFQKIKLFDLPNNEKWFKFNAYEFFIKIRKKLSIMINGVKHYVKYSMNEYINIKTKPGYLRSNDIYIYKMGLVKRRDVANVPNVPTFQKVLPNLTVCTSRDVAKTSFWHTSPAKLPVRP